MSAFPQELDLRRTPHFLFEIGSMMFSLFGALFVFAAALTVTATYVTGSLPIVGAIALVSFGALTLLGVGFVYWSSTFT